MLIALRGGTNADAAEVERDEAMKFKKWRAVFFEFSYRQPVPNI